MAFSLTAPTVWLKATLLVLASFLLAGEQRDKVTVFRRPSRNTNGNAFDFQGRLIPCEDFARRLVRWEHDGTMTVIADSYDGKPLNSPNGVAPHPDASTIRGGVEYNYRMIIVSDAVAEVDRTTHEAELQTMARLFADVNREGIFGGSAGYRRRVSKITAWRGMRTGSGRIREEALPPAPL
jgi:hypothetical protein